MGVMHSEQKPWGVSNGKRSAVQHPCSAPAPLQDTEEHVAKALVHGRARLVLSLRYLAWRAQALQDGASWDDGAGPAPAEAAGAQRQQCLLEVIGSMQRVYLQCRLPDDLFLREADLLMIVRPLSGRHTGACKIWGVRPVSGRQATLEICSAA